MIKKSLRDAHKSWSSIKNWTETSSEYVQDKSLETLYVFMVFVIGCSLLLMLTYQFKVKQMSLLIKVFTSTCMLCKNMNTFQHLPLIFYKLTVRVRQSHYFLSMAGEWQISRLNWMCAASDLVYWWGFILPLSYYNYASGLDCTSYIKPSLSWSVKLFLSF